MTDERLRELVRVSHQADAPPGFAATLRAARAGQAVAEPRRRVRPLLAATAALAAAGFAVLAWLAARDRDPAPPTVLVAPALEVPGPFDQLPSPFPGLAVADLIEDPW